MKKTIFLLDTSGNILRAGLFFEGSLKTFRRQGADFSGDALIFEASRRLLSQAKLDLKDLDAIAVSSGPGRFTGIRMGMTFAAMISSQLKIPALGISRLEALAFGSPLGLLCPVLAGYRGEKYYQIFHHSSVSRAPKPLGQPSWSPQSDWDIKKEEIEKSGAQIIERDAEMADFLAASIFYLAKKKIPQFQPLYLKAAGYEKKAQ